MTALALALAWGAGARAAGCALAVDGAEVDRLDCRAGGAWTVTCPLPDPRDGKARVTLHLPDRGLVGEARLPLSARGEVTLAVSGPGARAGAFLVAEAAAGLLPGQAIGPQQLCPVVQPGAVPGAPPQELPLAIRVTQHAVLGFDEVPMAGGVTTRVPRYDDGRPVATGEAVVVQRGVELVPILVGADAIALDEPVQGTAQVRAGETWTPVGWSGVKRVAPLSAADLSLLVLDLVAPEAGRALGGDPVVAVAADLQGWLGGDHTPLEAAWSRAGLRVPVAGLTLAEARRDAWGWRVGETARVQVRVGRQGDRLRVVVARSTADLDDEARRAIEEAASGG